jgi:hypothetical protein
MIDKFLSKTGVGIALLFMVAELSYINTKSLQYMFDEHAALDMYFGIVGAVAFSVVTVLIMRLSKRNWLTVVFPLFDIALVFCGFNLSHADTLLANPVRFAMSVFLSLFSGLITYSLGQINAEQHSGKELDKQLLESKNKALESNLNETKGELLAVKGNYEKLTTDYKVTRENEKLLQGKIDSLMGDFFVSETERLKAESNYNDLKSNFDDVNEKYKLLECDFIQLTTDFADTNDQNKVSQSEIAKLKNSLAEIESKLKDTLRASAEYKEKAIAAEVARIRKKRPENRSSEEIKLLEEAA